MTRTDYHPHGEQLSAYIDSRLDVPHMRGIGEHLHACAGCRSLEADLRRTKHLVRGLPAPTLPSADFWASAYRRLRVDDLERARTKRPLWAGWRSPAPQAHRRWAAGLALAVVAAGAFTLGPLTSTPHPASAPPPVRGSATLSPQDVSPDVSSLAELHTDSVSALPLADPDRQKMIAADARQAVNSPSGASEAASDADASF